MIHKESIADTVILPRTYEIRLKISFFDFWHMTNVIPGAYLISSLGTIKAVYTNILHCCFT